jgi:hypothetical protein
VHNVLCAQRWAVSFASSRSLRRAHSFLRYGCSTLSSASARSHREPGCGSATISLSHSLSHSLSFSLSVSHEIMYIYIYIYIYICRSQWLRGLRRRSAAARLLRSWVRIPPGECMFVCCECCVLSGRGLCDELITRPEESYRMWCVIVCDVETSRMRRPWPRVGSQRHRKKGPICAIIEYQKVDTSN